MKLPKTENFFSVSRINLRTLSMKTFSSPSESIKTSWGRWENQRLPKIWKENWLEGRCLELQGWTSLRVCQLTTTNSVLNHFYGQDPKCWNILDTVHSQPLPPKFYWKHYFERM
jgi:hypothetical protein